MTNEFTFFFNARAVCLSNVAYRFLRHDSDGITSGLILFALPEDILLRCHIDMAKIVWSPRTLVSRWGALRCTDISRAQMHFLWKYASAFGESCFSIGFCNPDASFAFLDSFQSGGYWKDALKQPLPELLSLTNSDFLCEIDCDGHQIHIVNTLSVTHSLNRWCQRIGSDLQAEEYEVSLAKWMYRSDQIA